MRTVYRQVVAPIALFLMMSGSTAGADNYTLQAGDTLELSVAGIPDLHRKSMIGTDGSVALPLIGSVPAAGLTVPEVRAAIQSRMASKQFRLRTSEGRENVSLISPDEVLVSVAEYRPVYVTGDVAIPGQQAFRPGMTVRQAIALAGGFDLMRLRMNNPFLESADFRSEHESLWTDLVREQIRNARLRAELSHSEDIDVRRTNEAPVDGKVVAEMIENEKRIMAHRRADHANQKQNFQLSIWQTNEQLKLLEEQRVKEGEGSRADAEEYGKVQEFFKKGNTSMLRLSDSRRVMLLSSTRYLQTTVQFAQANRDRLELSRKLQNFEEQAQIDLNSSLQESNLRVEQLKSKIEAVSEKLMYTSLVKSQLIRGKGSKPNLTLVRRDGSETKTLKAEEDLPLVPGDLIDVSLRPDLVGTGR